MDRPIGCVAVFLVDVVCLQEKESERVHSSERQKTVSKNFDCCTIVYMYGFHFLHYHYTETDVFSASFSRDGFFHSKSGLNL